MCSAVPRILKSLKFFTLIYSNVNLHCFICLISAKGVTHFRIFDSIVTFWAKKHCISSHLIETEAYPVLYRFLIHSTDFKQVKCTLLCTASWKVCCDPQRTSSPWTHSTSCSWTRAWWRTWPTWPSPSWPRSRHAVLWNRNRNSLKSRNRNRN